VIHLGRVDPTDNPMFRTTTAALDAVTAVVHSFNFNSYPPTLGLLEAKRFVSSNFLYNLIPTITSLVCDKLKNFTLHVCLVWFS